MPDVSISVVIPVYNYAHVVTRAINSVIPQLTEIDELLIINDGSKDNSDKVIRDAIEKTNSNVRYLCKENGGPSSVRNLGIQKASGNYLIFLDADDELTSDALSAIRDALSVNNPPQLLAGRHVSVFPDGSEKISRPAVFSDSREKNFLAYIKGDLRLANGPTVMAREIFAELRYPEDLRQSEDVPVFALALANFSAAAISAVLAKIYKSHTSMRHDYEKTCAVGIRPVEYIFNNQLLPESLQRYYNLVCARRYLSMSRSAWLAGNKKDCLHYYHMGFRRAPRESLKWTYLGKYLKSLY